MATYESRSSKVVVANAVLISLTGSFILVRFWARVFLLHQVGLDDILVWTSSALFFLLAGLVISMTKYGLGQHITDVPDSDLEKFFKLDFAAALSYIWAFVIIKISFAVFYLRVIPTHRLRRLNYILIAILVAQGIEETFVVCFACRPIYKSWQPWVEGSCINRLTFYYVSFGIKLATDLVLFIEPIPTLSHLKLPWVKRVGLIIMFSLGLTACVISIVRATYLRNTSSDATWRLVNPIDWSTGEVCSLIVCACIPYLRNLLAEIPWVNKALSLSSIRSRNSPSGSSPKSHSSARPVKETSTSLEAPPACIFPGNCQASRGSFSAGSTATATATHHANVATGCNSHGHHRATESTEEIFSSYMSEQDGIVVSTDVKVTVESSQSQEQSSYSEP